MYVTVGLPGPVGEGGMGQLDASTLHGELIEWLIP